MFSMTDSYSFKPQAPCQNSRLCFSLNAIMQNEVLIESVNE